MTRKQPKKPAPTRPPVMSEEKFTLKLNMYTVEELIPGLKKMIKPQFRKEFFDVINYENWKIQHRPEEP